MPSTGGSAEPDRDHRRSDQPDVLGGDAPAHELHVLGNAPLHVDDAEQRDGGDCDAEPLHDVGTNAVVDTAARALPTGRDDPEEHRNGDKVERPVDARRDAGAEQHAGEDRAPGSEAGQTQNPQAPEHDELDDDLRIRVAREVQLHHLHREGRSAHEREHRSDDPARQRVEHHQRHRTDDRRQREHQVVAAEPAGLGEEHTLEVRELEVHRRAVAVDRGRVVPQSAHRRERTDIRPEHET